MDTSNTENKLLILYLINKMDLPLSRSRISDYFTENQFMDYYTVQETLAELVDSLYLDAAIDDNVTRYTVTGEGLQTLEFFEKHIPIPKRAKINQFIKENRRDIKREFEKTVIFFHNTVHNDFIIKCGVYDEDQMLMELSISVDTREQARMIETNWNKNAKTLYGDIIQTLVRDVEDKGNKTENEE